MYILGMSSSQLTNSIVFQRGRPTTNQVRWKASRVSWRSNPIQSNACIILIQGISGVLFFHYEIIHVCFGHGLPWVYWLYHAISCYINYIQKMHIHQEQMIANDRNDRNFRPPMALFRHVHMIQKPSAASWISWWHPRRRQKAQTQTQRTRGTPWESWQNHRKTIGKP